VVTLACPLQEHCDSARAAAIADASYLRAELVGSALPCPAVSWSSLHLVECRHAPHRLCVAQTTCRASLRASEAAADTLRAELVLCGASAVREPRCVVIAAVLLVTGCSRLGAGRISIDCSCTAIRAGACGVQPFKFGSLRVASSVS
jgi:hypothetical protein